MRYMILTVLLLAAVVMTAAPAEIDMTTISADTKSAMTINSDAMTGYHAVTYDWCAIGFAGLAVWGGYNMAVNGHGSTGTLAGTVVCGAVAMVFNDLAEKERKALIGK